jgi:outer membrane protein TolC
MALGLWSTAQAQTIAPMPGGADASSGTRVSLKDFAALIANADESVLAQRLEEASAEQGVRGANALFEPFFTSTLEREGMNVSTSSQDKARLGIQQTGFTSLSDFISRESRLKNALNVKSIYGTDVEFSYNLTNWVDSIQETKQIYSAEKRGYMGFKITQPIMRGAGEEVTRLGIDVAEREKGVARETWRQVLAQRVMDGVQAYIFVQRAEERVRLRTQARDVALEIERNMTQQHEGGLRSASEMTEARASLALREAQLAQALQDLEEQQNAMQVFLAGKESDPGAVFTASKVKPADRLETVQPRLMTQHAVTAARQDMLKTAMEKRPESRVNALRIEREVFKTRLAQDQARPELNFNMTYGKEDLGLMNRNWSEYFGGMVPHQRWMVGVTYRVGLFGDVKRDSDYQSAIIRREQSELALGAVKQRITNEVLVSTTVLTRAEQQAARQHEIVSAQRQLLRVEGDLVKEGRRSTLDVLKKRLELLVAEEALADAVAQADRASYLNSQVEGALLARVGLE